MVDAQTEKVTAPDAQHARGGQRTLEGIVRRTKMQKTVIVEVTRRVLHDRYKKYITQRTNYMAHDEQNECRAGDRVELSSARPLSRHKRWRIARIVERSA